MILISTLNPCSDGVLIDPILAPPRRFTSMIGGSGPGLLERFLVWRRLAREVVLASLGAWPQSARLRRTSSLPGEQACGVEL